MLRCVNSLIEFKEQCNTYTQVDLQATAVLLAEQRNGQSHSYPKDILFPQMVPADCVSGTIAAGGAHQQLLNLCPLKFNLQDCLLHGIDGLYTVNVRGIALPNAYHVRYGHSGRCAESAYRPLTSFVAGCVNVA